jgi:hypothetical protein
MRPSVGDDIGGESVELPDIAKVKFCSSVGCTCGVSQNEVTAFTHQVYRTHHRHGRQEV